MKTCFLIDSEYPYSQGEPFLETEMDYLAQAFDKVIIFSISVPRGAVETRAVPENVESYAVGDAFEAFRHIRYAAKGLFSCGDIPIENGSFSQLVTSTYMRGRACWVFREIQRIIEEKYSACLHNAVFYSYWFATHAVVAGLLKDLYADNGVTAFSRAHGYDLYAERNRLGFLPYQDVSASKLEGVYACSENGRAYLSAKYPSLSEKFKVARLGTKDCGLAPYRIKAVRVFVTCCKMDPIKRMPLFAKAFVELLKRDHANRWICIGDGADLPIVKQIAEESHCSDRIEFMGFMSNAEVLRFYKNNEVDFFCNVSSSEGLPVSIMEALSFGIPVIAVDVGGIGELINENNGVLLPVEITSHELAASLSAEASESVDVRQLKRLAARKTWEDMVCAEKNYVEWCKIICGCGEAL